MSVNSVFVSHRSILRSDRVIIHINLSISMMVAQMLLLLSGLATKNQVMSPIIYVFVLIVCLFVLVQVYVMCLSVHQASHHKPRLLDDVSILYSYSLYCKRALVIGYFFLNIVVMATYSFYEVWK